MLLQLHAIDPHIKLYPWRCQDYINNPPIELSTICNNTFFDLHTYVPHLTCQQDGWKASRELGHTRHPYIFLKYLVNPSQLMAGIGPWLRETKQGMWPQQLQEAEQTTCIGWLLFSTSEYDMREIRRIIKETMVEEVALRFCSIHNKVGANTVCLTSQTKAIHIEVDNATLLAQCQCIATMYSSKVQLPIRYQNAFSARTSQGVKS